jgi:hypothetical protein
MEKGEARTLTLLLINQHLQSKLHDNQYILLEI